MILPYETVFSRARGRIDDPKELSLNEIDLSEIYVERLHNVIGKPRIRRLFSSLIADDEIQEIEFELNHSVDEYSDIDFVCNLFILGMTIEWIQPQVDSIKYTMQFLGGKEEKMLNNPYAALKSRLADCKSELNRMICDYGYMYNSYILES